MAQVVFKIHTSLDLKIGMLN